MKRLALAAGALVLVYLAALPLVSRNTYLLASILILFIRILPDKCAIMVWPLSNRTLKVVAGSNSSIVPLTSIMSLLAIYLKINT